jgi:hypothetical protein
MPHGIVFVYTNIHGSFPYLGVKPELRCAESGANGIKLIGVVQSALL